MHKISGTRYDNWDAHLPLQIAIVDALAHADKPLSKIEITQKLGKHPVNTPIGGLTRLLDKQRLVICKRDGSRLLYSLTREGYEAANDHTMVGKPPQTSRPVVEALDGAEDVHTVVGATKIPTAAGKAAATKQHHPVSGHRSGELGDPASENRNGVGAYSITALRRQGVGGMHCLQATVIASQQTQRFNGSRYVELTLRVLGEPDVLVELCDIRGKARLNGGSLCAAVGEPFELFFRLAGTKDAGVLVELYHSSADFNVTPFALDEHFSVTAEPRQAQPVPVIVNSPIPVPEWLLQFSEGGVRQVFEHLAAHGVVTESEATKMLGGPRELRSFAREFDKLVALCRFGVRIETVAGVKRFVREGTL